ncbi:MAG TPA: hypothetical protein VJM33_05780 [Microthrixaceae bacterium]|nr:hypothetical protein [Microthrixaceae bacterium]
MRARCTKGWNDESSDRPRVLIECTPEASPTIIASVVERHGLAVRTCVGGAERRCDLLDHGNCALVSGADVVVNLLGQHHETGRCIAEAVLAERRPPALVIEVPAAEASQRDQGAGEPTLLARPLRTATLLGAIRGALTSRDALTSSRGD